MATQVSGVITKTYDTITEFSNGDKLVLCDMSWNGGEPRTELRVIRKNGYFGPGVPISKKECNKLIECLMEMDAEESHDKKEAEGVDFSKIFESGASITKARDSGYTTKDGKIRLYRKKPKS